MQLGDLLEAERALRVEPEVDAGALQEDRVGGDPGLGGAQLAVADAVADHLGEARLVGVALGDQGGAGGLAEGADLAVGGEGPALVAAVEDDVLADRGGEPQRRPLWRGDGGVDLLVEPLHEVVLQLDQDRLLARVPVVDRGRADAGGGGDRPHRGRVVAEPGEEADGGAADLLLGLGPALAPLRRRRLARRRGRVAARSAKAQQLPGLLLGRDLAAEGAGEADRHLDQRRVGGGEDAAADVGDVLEPGADAGGAAQQRQRRASAGGGGRCR